MILTKAELQYFGRCASSLRAITAQAEALAGAKVSDPDRAKRAFFHSLAALTDNLGLQEQTTTFRLAARTGGPAATPHHD